MTPLNFWKKIDRNTWAHPNGDTVEVDRFDDEMVWYMATHWKGGTDRLEFRQIEVSSYRSDILFSAREYMTKNDNENPWGENS